MAAVNELVVAALRAYPGLYTNGYSVLDTIFCTVGGSYQWAEDGTVELIPGEVMVPWTREADEKRMRERFGDLYDEFDERNEARYAERAAVVANAETLARDFTPVVLRQGVISERMANVPANATAEWLEAMKLVTSW